MSAGVLELGDLLTRYAVLDRSRWHLRASFVASLDGAAALAGRSGPLGSSDDALVLAALRTLADVALIGAGTIRAEGYGAFRLPDDAVGWRRSQGLPDHPRPAVVSAALDLDPAADLFTGAPVPPLVLTTAESPADRRRSLSQVADVVVCGGRAVDPATAREALVSRDLPQVLCEGGPRLFGTLLRADLVDEVCLTVSPLLEGGEATRISVGGAGSPVPMRLAHALAAGDHVMLRYLRRSVGS